MVIAVVLFIAGLLAHLVTKSIKESRYLAYLQSKRKAIRAYMASDIVSYRKDSECDTEFSVDSKRDCCVKRSETYYHTKQSEVSNVESKQDFSPMASNENIL